MNAKVSIIVPAYNVEEYISETLQSLINQTYTNIEIIVVNDGSTDNTQKVAEIVQDSRIRVVNKPNGGASSARNYGLNVCSGDIVTFVDGDDIVSNDMIEGVLPAFDDAETTVAIYSILLSWQGENHRLLQMQNRTYSKKKELYKCFLANKFTFSVCNKLFRRSLFDSVHFREDRVYEDIIFWADCLQMKSLKIVTCERGIYYYRARSSSFIHSEVSFRKIDDFVENSLTIYNDAKIAKVSFKSLLDYYFSIIEDIEGLHKNRLATEEQQIIVQKMRENIPSRLKVLSLRILFKISSRKYKLYNEKLNSYENFSNYTSL